MIRFFNLKDAHDSPLFGAPFFDNVVTFLAEANSEVQVNIPDGAEGCIISAPNDFYVGYSPGIIVPTTSVPTQISGAFNRSILQLKNIYNQPNFIEPSILYFVCPQNTYITIEFFLI